MSRPLGDRDTSTSPLNYPSIPILHTLHHDNLSLPFQKKIPVELIIGLSFSMAIVEVTSGNNRQLQNIANTLAAAKKVVVFTGAGISTNCGIPVSLRSLHLNKSLLITAIGLPLRARTLFPHTSPTRRCSPRLYLWKSQKETLGLSHFLHQLETSIAFYPQQRQRQRPL